METRVNELLRSSSNYLGNIKCDISPGTAPFKCAVDTCKNKFDNLITHQLLSTYKFHNFPQQCGPRQKWKALCNLPVNVSTTHLKVCSDHFTLDDYARNLKEELLNPAHKRTLKETALPSVNIKPVSNEKLKEYLAFSEISVVNVSELLQDTVEPEDDNKSDEDFRKELLALRRNIRSLHKKITHSEENIKRKNRILVESRKSLKELDSQLKKLTKHTLRPFLSETQISLLKGKKKVFWTDDDLAQAFTLRHMGGKEFYLLGRGINSFLKMSLCSITGCPNSKPGAPRETVFYFVPKDLSRASKWANVLKDRIGDTTLLEALVCAKHFENNMFLTQTKQLKGTAVPSLFPQEGPPSKKFKASFVKILPKLEERSLIIDQGSVKAVKESVFILEANPSVHFENESSDDKSTSLNVVNNFDYLVSVKEGAHTKKTGNGNDSYTIRQEVERLRKIKRGLTNKHKRLLQEESTLSETLASVRSNIVQKNKELKSAPEVNLPMLTKCLSNAQINHLLGKRRARWSLDDLAVAYVISSLTSHDFYSYLRNELKYPLPAISNVSRCFKTFDRKDMRVNRCKNLENDE